MSFPFDPQQGLIIVPTELWGTERQCYSPSGTRHRSDGYDGEHRNAGRPRLRSGIDT